ncbi:MAG: DUF2062 domain-containing protein [Gammaproteobacteria bacterium]|jgi:hypothetical protein|nr:DUF2062 domain-containing protein [Gammaproteobacteria bacterium]MDP6615860.1 DUF2062 domain-containing protein [Gammaproteobacteria bacterium]MDP6694322.1 DUF2062 domain-containing protein [Gammaproteobacteria bacterium]MDP7042175.1 DUF2062 domain-containing protein [Gammaproteobacteria bacterium]
MPRRFFSRVSKQYNRNGEHPWYLKPFDFILEHPIYFAPTRRSVGGGVWLGIFYGLLPIPGQTPLAVLSAFVLRVNVPVAAITVWISNPLTFVPIFYLGYRIGAAILNIPAEPWPDEITLDWLTNELAIRWKPLIYGALILSTSAATAVYVAVNAIWQASTMIRYRRRHRRPRKTKRAT